MYPIPLVYPFAAGTKDTRLLRSNVTGSTTSDRDVITDQPNEEHYSIPSEQNTFNGIVRYIFSASHYTDPMLECPTVLLIQQPSHLLRLRLITSTLQTLPLHNETAHLQKILMLTYPKSVSKDTITT